MSGLYLDSGYVDMGRIITDKRPFAFVWGGRGTGKTYGALDYCLSNDIRFMYLRRTQAQLDMINKPLFSPLNPVISAHGWHISIGPVTDKTYGYYWADDDGNAIPDRLAGFTAALSTVSNLRGFAATDIVDVILYDEFIPELHERPIKHECDALLNCYETINRNRELQGRKPLKMVCMSNSNMLTNPIFEGLQITKYVTKMRKNRQSVYYNDNRGFALYALDNSPISLAKRDTALYRLASADTAFGAMALKNDFNYSTGSRIESCNLLEYKPVVSVGDYCMYTHKTQTLYYWSSHISGSPAAFGDNPAELRRFNASYGWLWQCYLRNQIIFETVSAEKAFTDIFCG